MRSPIRRPAAALLPLILALLTGCGSDEVSDSGGGGAAIQGKGYSIEAPDGWKDRTQEASADSSIKPDRVLVGETKDGFATNMNVVFEPKPDASLAEVGEGFRMQIKSIGAMEISAASERKLAGDDAVTYTYTLDQGGKQRRARQVAAIHGDRLYTVSMTAAAEGYDEGEKRLDEILASWKWK